MSRKVIILLFAFPGAEVDRDLSGVSDWTDDGGQEKGTSQGGSGGHEKKLRSK